MTQEFPPPDRPEGAPLSGCEAPAPSRPPLSAAAMAGFVMSLLGCTGVGAVGGLIFGVAGIVRTRGGRRRGRGFAVAAIPISVCMGTLSILFGLGMIMAKQFEKVTGQLPEVFAASPAAAENLRALCSEEFNERVSPEALGAWLDEVAATHGRLVELRLDEFASGTPSETGAPAIAVPGRFVNGTASIRITLSRKGVAETFRFIIDDIEVDGSSPRRSDSDAD